MKRYFGLALLALSSVAAAADGTVVSEKDYALPTCPHPIASVMIGAISCKSPGCQTMEGAQNGIAMLMQMAQEANGGATSGFPGIADGFGAMLTTALQKTGCFDIQDRESIAELRKEMELVGRPFEPEPADFLISGAITSISMTTKRRAFGGGYIPVVGAVASKKANAELSLDLKITEMTHGKLLAASTFVGNNQTSSMTVGGAFGGGNGGLIGLGSNVKGTPMEDVVRDVLIRAAAYTSTQIIALKTPAAGAPPVAVSTPTDATLSPGQAATASSAKN